MAIKFSPISAAELVRAVNGTVLRGNADRTITELGEPLEVGRGGVSFIISQTYLKDAAQTKGSVLVAQAAFAEQISGVLPATVELCITCPDAYVGLAKFSKILADADPVSDWRIDVTAVPVHPTASIDPTARLGPGAIVGERARIGAKTVVLGNAVIGPEAQVGSDCVIYPGVVLYPRTVLGNRVRVHANTVLGSDGFGYAPAPEGAVKIWHLGRVIVGDDVEIGAGTTIDRGTIKDTIIENGVKIDNLVQIGHNGHVKANANLCAQVGLAGNVTVGRGVILAGKVGVANQVKIGDGAMVGPMSGVTKDVKPGAKMMGQQRAVPLLEWRRLLVFYEGLPKLYERVKALEQRLKGGGPDASA